MKDIISGIVGETINTSIISDYTRQEMIDIMNGTSNAEYASFGSKYSYFWGRS